MAGTKAKTSKEILAEIAKLKDMKPFVTARSMFGDDNHAKIDAQIKALGTMDDEGDADSEWPEDADNEIRQAAVDAIDWKNGDSSTVPSEDWANLDSRKRK